ncbi:MAG TPA: hypothetical protein VHV30_05710 [Polyangiaceae bacterium]|nr:hypothetical protein [Polyangiaceae bacterium]
MLVRVLRATLFASVLLAVWSFARPAQAQVLAPFSDDRGATGIALPPALQAPEDAMQRAAAPPSFSLEDPVFGLAFDHGRRPGPSASSAQDPAVASRAIVIAPAASAPLEFVLRETSPPTAPPVRLERPPRA